MRKLCSTWSRNLKVATCHFRAVLGRQAPVRLSASMASDNQTPLQACTSQTLYSLWLFIFIALAIGYHCCFWHYKGYHVILYATSGYHKSKKVQTGNKASTRQTQQVVEMMLTSDELCYHVVAATSGMFANSHDSALVHGLNYVLPAPLT